MKALMNQNGQLTLEFMFSLILVVTISTLLGILTFTLSLTEALQYVTFAGARAYFAADLDKPTQADAGQAKMHSLLTSLPFLSGALGSGWITISPNSKDRTTDFTGYQNQIGAVPYHSQFVGGAQLQITVPILDVQIPFIKDLITPPNGAKGFSTTLSSFLTREPSYDECLGFVTAVPGWFQKTYTTLSSGTGAVPIILDNGC